MEKIEPLLKEEVETFGFLQENKKEKKAFNKTLFNGKVKVDKSFILTLIIGIIVVLFVGRSCYAFYIGFKYFDLRYENTEVQTKNETSYILDGSSRV